MEELRGIQKGANDAHSIKNTRILIQRILTISSYPGDFTVDITYALVD